MKLASFLGKRIRRVLKSPIVVAIALASLLLGGCVDYDLGVNFVHANKGQIIQSIKLNENLTDFSGPSLKEWLNSVELRATELGGRTRRISESELKVSIPFNNGKEFEKKFNQFFNPTGNQKSTPATADFPKIKSQLSLSESNYLLAVQNRLSYDLDLRSLEHLSPDGSVVIDPRSLLQLEFRLNAPWGASSDGDGENNIIPESLDAGHQLIWQLQPGKVNHLEAEFWLPSPLGIGAVVIALLVGVGIFLKEKVIPKKRAIVNF